MHTTNSADKYTASCHHGEIASAATITAQAAGTSKPAAPANQGLAYQRSFSKTSTKVSKYTDSGATQRNGITATSWQIRFVVAMSSVEPHAARPIQNNTSRTEGRAVAPCSLPSTASGFACSRSPSHAHSTANPAYRPDHS